MENLTFKTFSGNVRGTRLKFQDLESSRTVPIVFSELNNDRYGLEKINLSPEDTVIDIGANVGMFSIYVKKKFGCKVISFEPVPINFENFKKNIILNGLKLKDFELHQVAIGDVDGGQVNIYTPKGNTGASSITYSNSEIISICKMETIDKYISPSCKYLKIDCEGAEYQIIPQLADKINQFDYLGIEIHQNTKKQNFKKLVDYLNNNYKGEMFMNLWLNPRLEP